MGFRPDIEGLRGVCVAAVVLFHAFPAWLPGGFTGVDSFFVISGFLITQLLVTERDQRGTIDLGAFWARRIRRILASATVVLLATCVLACVTPGFDSRELGKNAIAAALFGLNWRLASKGTEYLAESDEANPLLHYWSLAVEEQFYVAWPLLVLATFWMGAVAAGKTRLAAIVLVAIAASMALSFYLATGNPSLAFFGTTTRVWQLLIGAAAALALSLTVQALRNRTALDLIAASAAVGLVASFLAIKDHTAYPSYVALAPTLATAALLYVGGAQSGNGARNVSAVLSNAPLRSLGRVSYSFYLWHWPLIVFATFAYGPANEIKWLAIALSLALAAATYQLIERPARSSAWLSASNVRTFGFGAALIAAAVAAGLLLRFFGPDEVALGDGRFISREAIKKDRPPIYDDGCLLRLPHVSYATCAYGDARGKKTVVLIGDSHAGNWFTPLTAAASKLGWKVLVRVKSGCRPVDAEHVLPGGRPYPECATWRSKVMDELRALWPDLVIVASKSHGRDAEDERRVLEGLSRIAPLVAMRSMPILPETVASCLNRTRDQDACVWPLSGLLSARPFPLPESEETVPRLTVLDLNHRICPDGQCRAMAKSGPVMTDSNHLASSFAAAFEDVFVNLLNAQGPARD